MIQAGDVKKGHIIEHNDSLWRVVDVQEAFVGKRGKYAQVKMKNLDDGHTETQRFATSDKLEKAYVETRKLTFLYEDTGGYVFMNPENGEQFHVDQDLLGEMRDFLTYNMELDIDFHANKAVGVQMPASVVLEVTKADPAVKGNTATSVTKPVELETGVTVKVPGHITKGEKIRVDTRSRDFLGRE